MEIAALLVIQLIATAAAFALIWRKLDQVGADVSRIKQMLETLELMRFSSAAQKRAQPARAEAVLAPTAAEPPSVSGTSASNNSAWVRPGARAPREEPLTPVARAPMRTPATRQMMANEIAEDGPAWRANVSPETGRLIAAAAMALSPALGFMLGAPAAALTACGLSISTALMLVSLRPMWRAAAFVGVLGAGGWAVAAFALNAAQTAPELFSIFAAIAGVVGLAHARLRAMAPGAAMSLLMGAALLALGNAIGLAGAAGIGYGVLVVSAAVVGASTTRVAGLHLSAFAAAMLGLFVFSGQEPAAIWFTPIAAWIGAVFFAIAAVRTPMLGGRGAMLAATGVTAPLISAGSLSLSQQGLANPFAAAGAFLCLAIMFGALLAVSAQHGQRGVKALQVTGWILTAGALVGATTAALLAMPAAFAVSVLCCVALGLAVLNFYMPQQLWRAGAVALFLGAGAIAWFVLTQGWPNALALATSLAIPALIASGAALVSQRRSAGAAAVFEGVALFGGGVALTAMLRLVLSGGAPNTMPIGFVEAGLHIAAWTGAALAIGARADRGATAVRRAAAAVFGIASVCASAIAALLWLTPFWVERPLSGLTPVLFQHAPLGFAAPAILAWAHWAFWRQRGVHMRTRVALGSAALLTAAFISLEVFTTRESGLTPDQTDWISSGVTVVVFVLAIAINFAPGVTDETGARSRLNKYFQRNRRGEQRI